MRSMGEVIADMMPVMDRTRRRFEARKREFLDGGGRCISCFDSGIRTGRYERDDPAQCCPDCPEGAVRRAQIRAGVVQSLAATSPVTPRALPLDSMRCKDAPRVAAAIAAWCDGWQEGWKTPTPHQENRPFLILHGPTGSGKTSAAAPAARARAARPRMPAAFVNVQQAVQALRDRAGGRADGSYEGDDALARPGPLVVDDLGIVSLTDFTEEFHYSVIHARYEKKWPTIFTTNSPIDPQSRDSRSLIRRIGDRPYWRIIELATVLPVEGYNWRDPRNRR
jgi:hypothetical protein